MTKSRIVIGVSKLSTNYANWLNKLHNGLEIVDFYSLEAMDVASHFHSISGLLLTGGGDIDPNLYGRKDDLPYCKDIDARRDKLEIGLIELAFTFNIPMLGICRGQQILNVVKKGTLYSDIPAFFKGTVIHQNKEDVYHPVTVNPDSLLFKLTLTQGEMVNSSHHQAVNKIGDGFVASAFSPDGLIEAMETKKTMDQSFCLAIQWHPERMDFDNPLSVLLGRGFIKEALNR
jgi:putative glutamine amidotransferase